MSKQPTPRRRAQAGSNKIEIPMPVMAGVPQEPLMAESVAHQSEPEPEIVMPTQAEAAARRTRDPQWGHVELTAGASGVILGTKPRRFSLIRGFFRPIAKLVGWVIWLAAMVVAGH
jgi:hypothetical protein